VAPDPHSARDRRRASRTRAAPPDRDDPAGIANPVGLSRAEKACYPFFDFTLDIGTGTVALVVDVPNDAQAILDDFARLAGTT
jgi:hypothetical protein